MERTHIEGIHQTIDLLIAYVLGVMRTLGYTHGKLPTQTTSWLACKVYLDFGFTPIPQNAERNHDGWRIVKALTNHPALAEFTPADLKEILAENFKKAEET